MPKVSVVIPTYNRKDTLGEAIASVFGQTFKDFEIIVVDHGSSDGTSSWAAQKYGSAIRLIGLENCPLPACPRNRGIQEAKGEFIAFLDSDDVWLPKKLELQIRALEARPDAGWSYGMAERFGQGVPKGTPEIGWWQVHSGNVFEAMVLGNFVPSCTVLARARALEAVGPFDMSPDLRSAEDYELWLRLAARFPACAVKETIALYRVAYNSVSQNLASRFDPEKNALESIQRKLNVHPELMRRAMAALHMRHFRYNLNLDPAKALAHLQTSWELNPRSVRTAIYKTTTSLGGALAARGLIAAEKWIKRCVG